MKNPIAQMKWKQMTAVSMGNEAGNSTTQILKVQTRCVARPDSSLPRVFAGHRCDADYHAARRQHAADSRAAFGRRQSRPMSSCI
jgi:hypothetical protein